MDTINYHGMTTKAVNFKGCQIIQNNFNDGWMLFFDSKEKYASQPPFAGTLSEMKSIINTAIKLGRGGEKYLIKENTYK